MNAILLAIGLPKLMYIFERGTIACEIFVYNFLLSVLLIFPDYI